MLSLLQKLEKGFLNKAFLNKNIEKQINIEIVESLFQSCEPKQAESELKPNTSAKIAQKVKYSSP